MIISTMKHRIFIAILLPEELKIKIAKFQENLWPSILQSNLQGGLRWVKTENLHFTLAFIGWVDEEQIVRIKEVVRDISQRFPLFPLKLTKVTLGPNEKYPRMLWVVGEKEKELEKIWQEIRNKLKEIQIPIDEHHPPKIHLTLARARGRELFGKKIDQKIDLNFLVKEIAIMESHLNPGGAEYKTLSKFPLR